MYYTIRVWLYETLIVFVTVIGRYLAVKAWEGLNNLIIIIIYIQNTIIINKFNKSKRQQNISVLSEVRRQQNMDANKC